MNPSTLRRAAVALLAVIALAAPMHAAKRRAVAHRVKPLEFTVNVSGIVLDAVTNGPVVSAEVVAGTRSTFTDAEGRFELKNVFGSNTVDVQVQRSGYVPSTVVLKPTDSPILTFRLAPTPTVRVVLTDGAVKNLDFESLQFGYPQVFTGYIQSPSEDFCKITDSTKINVDRSQMAKLAGPAQTVAAGACCTGNAQKMTLTLKTGEVMEVIFMDTCQERNRVDVIGREHVNAQFVQIPIGTISEVVFP
jgi:hypothetical protein